ncbi:hypothetical protein NQ314_014591 [Rhamnusium bicolor]|uniref:Transmembrane protein 231 n=1 Tax=Rhamnusium bicolor TaxID=1586634 RepID=A0AAV8X243_9CUCU|nr:hypothetical protein NQ314_014591 [Rhamnusium bicolor]
MFTIILPFIFAFKSGGFWLKRDIFYEQPKVNLRGEYLLIATTNNISNPIICSTFPYYKQNLDFLDVCSIIKLREIDNNLDGIVDKIRLNIGLNLFKNKITSINIILPINYKLTSICPLQMQSGIIYQHYFHHTMATDLQVVGDLDLFQSSSLHCSKKGIHDFYDYSIIEDEINDNSYELENIIERYSERNISTHLTNVYTNVISGNKNKFNIKLSVRYPEHKISYKPGFWHIMKLAWIQYFAIYVIIYWFVKRIRSYVFNHRLVLFYEESPTVKRK